MEITTNAKSIELTGEEVHVHFASAFPYFWLRNDGTATVQMSLSPNIEEGKDGVIEVPAGSSAGTMHGYDATRSDFYILGSGKVQIMGTYTPENPFRKPQKGGGGNVSEIKFNSHNILADYDVISNTGYKIQDGDTVTYTITKVNNTQWQPLVQWMSLKAGKLYKLTVSEDYYGCGRIGIGYNPSSAPQRGQVIGNFQTCENLIYMGNANTKYFYINTGEDVGKEHNCSIWIYIWIDVERVPYSFNIGLYEEI